MSCSATALNLLQNLNTSTNTLLATMDQ
ncbi:hypothetical protein Gohar_014205 [Gossypium harknessii]|uniref:Uncharacterized protein n=1 Tax=Gossypium harknessii TaxID=34285 RepID=A0A7J9H2H2_9ROSI|nr:hypothetical protein [Gossypium harknessii]